jgi:hypothetical protein
VCTAVLGVGGIEEYLKARRINDGLVSRTNLRSVTVIAML